LWFNPKNVYDFGHGIHLRQTFDTGFNIYWKKKIKQEKKTVPYKKLFISIKSINI